MKLIIAGSRELKLTPKRIAEDLLNLELNPTQIVSGCCRGPDTVALEFAEILGLDIKKFPAQWDTHGIAKAGRIRNREMGDYADALLAYWDATSPGTKDMINYMEKLKKPVYVVYILDNQLDL